MPRRYQIDLKKSGTKRSDFLVLNFKYVSFLFRELSSFCFLEIQFWNNIHNARDVSQTDCFSSSSFSRSLSVVLNLVFCSSHSLLSGFLISSGIGDFLVFVLKFSRILSFWFVNDTIFEVRTTPEKLILPKFMQLKCSDSVNFGFGFITRVGLWDSFPFFVSGLFRTADLFTYDILFSSLYYGNIPIVLFRYFFSVLKLYETLIWSEG